MSKKDNTSDKQMEEESEKKTFTQSDLFCVGVRLPPFWLEEPALLFAQIEGSFALSGVKADDTKYNYVSAQLKHRYAAEAKDILINPPAKDKYEKLKSELIKRLSASREKELTQLVMHEELGDRRPSAFLRHLQHQPAQAYLTILSKPFQRETQDPGQERGANAIGGPLVYCLHTENIPTVSITTDMEVPEALRLRNSIRKSQRQSSVATHDCPNLTTGRLFVTDRQTKTQFLVDTGSDICVFPRAALKQKRPRSTEFDLFAANETPIAVYGSTNGTGLRPPPRIFLEIYNS